MAPATVLLKRKRSEDGPDVLSIENEFGEPRSKRRHRNYVFVRQIAHQDEPVTRQRDEIKFTAVYRGARLTHSIPKILATKPGDEYRNPYRAKKPTDPSSGSQQPHYATTRSFGYSEKGCDTSMHDLTPLSQVPRRFHISRTSNIVSHVGQQREQQAYNASTILIESRSILTETLCSPRIPRVTTPKTINFSQPYEASSGAIESIDNSQPSRPNLNPVTATARGRSTTKYSPKVPSLRFRERYPIVLPKHENSDSEDHGVSTPPDLEEDMDYVVDTYVRMPADKIPPEISSRSHGLLVLDSQPDVDIFFNDEGSDEDGEALDDEEDENAENHPSADYPDEEDESDEDMNYDPAVHRTLATSDRSESDGDFSVSDDDTESLKYPWSKRPWIIKSNVEDDEEE